MEHAPIFKEAISQYLPDKPIIIEAGAHSGRDTVKMASLWPKASMHVFEPVPELYAQLVDNTSHLVQVKTYNEALSNRTGEEILHVSSGASTAASSLLTPYMYLKERPNVFFNTQTVPTITLDDWAQRTNISHVDFLWLDMQGAERMVLEASQIVLPTVQIMVVEVSVTERFKDEPLRESMITFLNDRGFNVVQQDATRHNKCNLLCMRPYLV